MASAIVVVEAAADECLPVGGPRLTVVLPTAHARSGTFSILIAYRRLDQL